MAYDWSRVSRDELRVMYIERGLTGAQIAAELGGGLSRAAVLGRLGVLKLKKGGKPRVAKPRVRPRPLTAPVGPFPVPPEVAKAAPPQAVSATGAAIAAIETLDSGGCLAPSGDPRSPDFRYCGAAIWHGDYCRRHASLFYRPPSARPRNRRENRD